MNDAAEIISDPNWFPYQFSEDYNHISFIKTDASKLRKAPFLDERFVSRNDQQIQLNIDTVQDGLEKIYPSMPPFIFHGAFCCSTLMASALGMVNNVLVLKEPQILMSLANARRMLPRQNRSITDYETRFDLVFSLLQRPRKSGEQIVIKPTNLANNLLRDVTAKGAQIVVMYSNLEDFLISVLKKGEPCRAFIRSQFNIFSLDPSFIGKIPHREAMGFTDLQIATLVWRHQMEMFFQASDNKSRFFCLRDKEFLENKLAMLKETAAGLRLGHSDGELKKIAVSDVFNTNAKFEDQKLDSNQKAQDAKNIKKTYASELSSTLAWAENIKFQSDVFE